MPFHNAGEGFSPDSVDACAQPPVCSFEFPSSLSSEGRVSFHAPGLVTYAYGVPPQQVSHPLHSRVDGIDVDEPQQLLFPHGSIAATALHVYMAAQPFCNRALLRACPHTCRYRT
jgi:hypothetical protein